MGNTTYGSKFFTFHFSLFTLFRIFAAEMTKNQKINIILALACALLAALCVLSILEK